MQGGNVTVESVATSLLINTVTNGGNKSPVLKNKVSPDDIVFSNKFKKSDYKDQVTKIGWDNHKIADTINNPVKTKKGYNKYSDSTVTHYYIDDIHYVSVDDSNGKIIQIADLADEEWKND